MKKLLITLMLFLTTMLVMANEKELENWIIFENVISESEMAIESWMTAPFKDVISESEMAIESWMIVPFKNISAITEFGTTKNCGDFVITSSEDIYYFQGREYEVYTIYYDSVWMNFKIGVHPNQKQYVAYSKDFTMFFEKDKNGFGVRKIWFTSPEAQTYYDSKFYSMQQVIGSRHIDPCIAIKLIAVYVPMMRVEYDYN